METFCARCGEPLKNKKSQYCSSLCHSASQVEAKVQAWLIGDCSGTTKYGLSESIRNYLLEQSNHQCSKCGWGEENPVTHKCPLQINHIDGNAKHNRPSNLEVLCPNCHSLTPNFGNLNKGSGRDYRYSGYTPVSHRQMRPEGEKQQIIRQLRELHKDESTWSRYKICQCGELMHKNSKQCDTCRYAKVSG